MRSHAGSEPELDRAQSKSNPILGPKVPTGPTSAATRCRLGETASSLSSSQLRALTTPSFPQRSDHRQTRQPLATHSLPSSPSLPPSPFNDFHLQEVCQTQVLRSSDKRRRHPSSLPAALDPFSLGTDAFHLAGQQQLDHLHPHRSQQHERLSGQRPSPADVSLRPSSQRQSGSCPSERTSPGEPNATAHPHRPSSPSGRLRPASACPAGLRPRTSPTVRSSANGVRPKIWAESCAVPSKARARDGRRA